MTAPKNQLKEHLDNVVAMFEQIGKDAEQIAERFAGDVEGHLRVVESHLMEIINKAKPAVKTIKVDAKAAADAAAALEKEAADKAAAELADVEAAAKAAAEQVEADVKAVVDAAAAASKTSKSA